MVYLPVNHSPSGKPKAGSIPMIQRDGSSGTAGIISVVAILMMSGRLNAGKPSLAMPHKSPTTVSLVTNIAVPVNVRRYCTGHTTRGSCNYIAHLLERVGSRLCNLPV